MKLLQIDKFDSTDELYSNISNLCKCCYIHQNLYKACLICLDLIEAVGLYPNGPNLHKCF